MKVPVNIPAAIRPSNTFLFSRKWLLTATLFFLFFSCDTPKNTVTLELKSEVEKKEIHVGETFIFLVRVEVKGTTSDLELDFPELPENVKELGRTHYDSANAKGDRQLRKLYVRSVIVGEKPGKITIPPVVGKVDGIVRKSKKHSIHILPAKTGP